MAQSARLNLVEKIEQNLQAISTANDYNLDYSEIKYADKIPTEYGQNGLYWRDGKGEGEFGKTQDSQLWIEVDAVLPQNLQPAHKLGTLAIEDLERCFKSIGVCGAMSVKWKSDKWVETEGRTVCRVYYAVLVKYKNRI
ncbi:MAG: hypothetical protein AAF298_00345 [Cyanobacteria bacterium P01_A01_bin.40]